MKIRINTKNEEYIYELRIEIVDFYIMDRMQAQTKCE